jgi:hypothetical protein
MKLLLQRSLWIACLLVLASGCVQAEPPQPLLWKISDADNHLYLLGSFHALKPSDYPLAPSVDAAFADAEIVAFEMPPAELNSPELPRKMLAAARLPAGQQLQRLLSPELWQQLEAYCNRWKLPVQQFQVLEPWFVALLIGVDSLARNGYDPQLGLDRNLMARAASAGKPTLGLETGDDQVRLFDGMSPREQVDTLTDSLQEAAGGKELDRLHSQWRAGDDRGLYEGMAGDFRKLYPMLYQRIDSERNQAWLPKLRAMLDGEHQRDTLVVVGSLHLLGDEGLVAKLRAAGYKVERVN